MPQRAEVADQQVVEMEQEDCVAATFRAALVVGVGPDAGNKYAPDFIFAGAVDDHRVPFYRRYGVVVGVVVADSNDVGLLAGIAEAEGLIVWVGDDGRVPAFEPETSVAQPDYFCHVALYSRTGC